MLVIGLSQNLVFYLLNTLLYILTSIWVLGTPNTGPNVLFQISACLKAEKRRKSRKNDVKFGTKYVL